jgi:glycosyltransferase involved in cell wall biosynthesis
VNAAQNAGDCRICHINLASDYGGGERQTELLIHALAGRGWQQRLVVRRAHELVRRCADIPNLDIAQVSSNPVAAGLAARGSALVHAHEARCVYSGLLASMLFGTPYVLTRRVARPQKKSWIRDRSYRRASAVVAISNSVARHIQVANPGAECTVVLDAHAHFAADANESASIRHAYKNKILIGHIGMLAHSAKGQLTIIAAAREAATARPNWHFLLLGSGSDEALFRREISDLENIELVGFVDNVGDYLASFDLFVFPSLREALGSTLLDAMYFGLPIVATNVGGIPEVVENGVNGLLIEPGRADQLFDGIAAIVDDPARALMMGDANVAKSARFSADRMADAYEAIYRNVLRL